MKQPQVIITGFGRDIRLTDLVKKIGTPEEDDILKIQLSEGQIMNYRDVNLATQEEIEAFFYFTMWAENKFKDSLGENKCTEQEAEQPK